MILGFFEVMSYFQHELPLWKDAWKIKRELEQSIVRHLAGNVSHTTGQNRKRNKPSAQLGAPTKEVLDIMNTVKPRHPRSLTAKHANQGSKRKATESEGDAPSRSQQPPHSSCSRRRGPGSRISCKFPSLPCTFPLRLGTRVQLSAHQSLAASSLLSQRWAESFGSGLALDQDR